MDKVLVVGAGSGIGKATADKIESMEKFDVYRPDHEALDVTFTPLIRAYIRAQGPFNYIVYSAGINNLCWVKDMTSSSIMERIFDVNLFGFVKVVSKHLDEWPYESVSAVAISSDASEVPMRGSLAYCTSKAALDMSIRVMARELAPLWRVNGVAPGMVDGTAMTKYIDETIPEFRNWSPEYAKNYEISSVPSGRRATLEEVAETVTWLLLGPEQINGEIIKINGGKS